MANQSIVLTRSETIGVRKVINNSDAIDGILSNKVYTPSPEALENYQTLTTAKSSNEIVDLAENAVSRLKKIEDDYMTESKANAIAKKQSLIYG